MSDELDLGKKFDALMAAFTAQAQTQSKAIESLKAKIEEVSQAHSNGAVASSNHAPNRSAGEQAPATEAEPTTKPQVISPEILRLQQEVTASKKLAEESRAMMQAATKEAERVKLETHLVKAMSAVGVRPDSQPILLQHFMGKVSFGDNQDTVFLPVENGVAPVEAALEQWAQTEQGKPFIAPPNQGGSGTVRGVKSGGAKFDIEAIKSKTPQTRTPEENKALFNYILTCKRDRVLV